METPAELIALIAAREPVNRRRTDFYGRLDLLIPNWPKLARNQALTAWMLKVDCENGHCMFDRLRELWDDPVFAAEDFSALLRQFERSTQTESLGRSLDRMPVLAKKYEVLDLLGRGGNGEVYLVWSNETKKVYALKTIRRDLANKDEVKAAFRKEAQAWISLGDHPNITKAYFYEEVGPDLYITMDVVDSGGEVGGASLLDRLTHAQIVPEMVCRWFCNVADGLQHAYSHGVACHRDIKAANILIGADSVARVSDFGLAVTSEELLATADDANRVAGTPLYMAPEQFAGSSECDVRSDIYSLGVTLYQVASGGSFPFAPKFLPKSNIEFHRYFVEVCNLHQRVLPTPLNSPFWPVIETCLKKHPKDRYANIIKFRQALEGVGRLQGWTTPHMTQGQTDIWTYRDQGNTQMRLGNYDAAIAAFDKFLKYVPHDYGAEFNRAVSLENNGCVNEALAVYERLASGGNHAALVNASNCLKKLGRKAEALEFALRAVALDNQDADSWIAFGNAAYSLGKWTDAMGAYGRAGQLDVDNPTPAYNFALAAENSGASRQALAAYKTFLTLAQPDDSRRAFVEKAAERIRGNQR